MRDLGADCAKWQKATEQNNEYFYKKKERT